MKQKKDDMGATCTRTARASSSPTTSSPTTSSPASERPPLTRESAPPSRLEPSRPGKPPRPCMCRGACMRACHPAPLYPLPASPSASGKRAPLSEPEGDRECPVSGCYMVERCPVWWRLGYLWLWESGELRAFVRSTDTVSLTCCACGDA